MAGHHGIPLRGLFSTRSELRQGRFGRIFRNLPPASFGAFEAENVERLKKLGEALTAGIDDPFDGPDPEESGIPALYTYFGQFIDHDLTFDPVSLLTKQQDPDGLVDFRTPALDLDNIYGRGPDDQPYMYDGNKFRLGDTLQGAGVKDAHDLPRLGGRAIIGDPRNDENSIVSQLQGLFHRFHNRFVDDNPNLTFPEVQSRVRFHYQYVILNDFLPRLIKASVLDALKTDGAYDRSKLQFYHWDHYPFMPVEFSAAAYRLGHSMIRPGYRLNDDGDKPFPIFPTAEFPVGLTGFEEMKPGRAIDWARFIDIELRDPGADGKVPENRRRLQFAYKIDTSLVGPLGSLPKPVAADPPPSLAERNLLRGWRLGLPSGQAVARAMKVTPLTDDQILIGKALKDPAADEKPFSIASVAGGAFKDNCPLWTYILAEAALGREDVTIPVLGEAMTVSTPKLGDVGGRLVAEVFLGLMFGDNSSMLSLDPNFIPETGPAFALRDIVSYALG